MRNPPQDALIENMLLNQRRRGTSSSHLRPPRLLYEFKVEKVNGFPVSLSCHEKNSSTSSSSLPSSNNVTSTTSRSSLLDTTILFDYELLVPDPREDIVEVLQQDLPKWEFFLLYYVADDIGILGCDIEKQNIPNTTEASPVDVVSLSSYGTDVVDTRIASCQFLVDLEPGWICIPLQGTMKAEFVGMEADRPAVESFLANHVATVLNNSTDFFGIGVNKTVFVGSRVIPSPAPIVADGKAAEDTSSSDDYVSALAGALSAAGALLICIVLFALVRRRRRPVETESTAGDGMDKEVVMGGSDIAVTDVLPPGVPYTPTKSLDSKSDEDKSDEARCGSMESLANRLGREVIDPLQAHPAAYTLTNVRTASTVVSTEDESIVPLASIEEEETEAKKSTLDAVTGAFVGSSEVLISTAMTDALPPKHPTGPSSKVPPLPPVAKLPKTRRRRKKKKKKVATIVRSNSRENVKEMETITEGEEETSGDNQDVGGSDEEDEGSWCSTSDSEPGSRDPSPARSSRNSSREPSPARSVGSNEEAAMAAAVLPTWDTGRVIGPSSDTTSGTEKPKPKKLPPSWLRNS